MTKENRELSIFLVDDHPVVREGLSLLIRKRGHLTICGEASTVQEALEGIQKTKPDIAIVDLSLKQESGLDLIKLLVQMHPDILILVLSMLEETTYAEMAIRAGAKGYLMKEDLTDNVFLAIDKIVDGGMFVSDEVMENMLRGMSENKNSQSPEDLLSARELDVFKMIGQGMDTNDIAREMHISSKTVEAHRIKIKKKLDIQSLTKLAQEAYKWVQSE